VQDALEVRIAYAYFVHVVERIADVVDTRAALPDALGDEPRPAVQIELANICRVRWIGDEGERSYPAAAGYADGDETWLVDPPGHLAMPEAGKAACDLVLRYPERHAPAGAALAKPHDQSGFAPRTAVASRKDAERPVIAVYPGEVLLPVAEAG